MKRIIFFLVSLIACVSALGQFTPQWTPVINNDQRVRSIWPQKILMLPSDTVTVKLEGSFAYLNGSLYYKTATKWESLVSGYLQTFMGRNNVNAVLTHDDIVSVLGYNPDTLATRYKVQLDSIFLKSQIDLKLSTADAASTYTTISRTLDSLDAIRVRNNTKLSITDAASTYTTIPRFNDTAAAIQARIQTKEPLLGFTPVPNTRTINGYALTGNITLNKSDVGLANVDNTSDVNKPISTATQTALDGKVPTTRTVNGHALSADVTVTKSDVGLSNVPNTDATNAANITSGTLPDARLSANVTMKGNSFNGANQIPLLDGSGKLVPSVIPSLALVETFVVGSQAAMLALSAQMGDVAVRTDNDKSYILQSEPASTLSNWVQLLTPSSEADPVYAASSWYSTTNNASNWNTAYSWGNHASAGYAMASRTITINGTAYDLSANRSWTVGDVRTDGSYSNPAWITALAWAKLTGVPSTFTPSAHTHPYSDLTGTVPTWNQNTTGNAATATTATNWGVVPNSLNSPAEASGLTNLIGVHSNTYAYKFTAGAVQSWLGLGSNAYTSTSYFPSSGGTVTGEINTETFFRSSRTTSGYAWIANSVTTGYVYGQFSNTGGGLLIGLNGASGGEIATGAAAYSSTLSTHTATALNFGISQVVKYTIDASGNNIWTGTGSFGGSVTAATFTGGAYTISSGEGFQLGRDVGGATTGFYIYNLADGRYDLKISETGGAAYFASSVNATVFNGEATGLTGTASALSIGGNAATASNSAAWNGQAYNGSLAATVTYILVYDNINGQYRPATAAYIQSFLSLNTAAYQQANQNLNTSSNVTFATIDGSLIRSTGDVIAYYTSDRRLKNNIKPISNALHKVSLLSGNEYDWNEELQSAYKGHDYGLIAQEVESVLPGTTHLKADGFFGIKNQNQIIALLVEAIKELKHEVELLKK